MEDIDKILPLEDGGKWLDSVDIFKFENISKIVVCWATIL